MYFVSLSQFAVSKVKSAANGAITLVTWNWIHAVCSATIKSMFASICAIASACPASLALFAPLVGVLPTAGNAEITSKPSCKISVINPVPTANLFDAAVFPA